MLTLLSAVNAKFIHSSLALHSIAAYNAAYGLGDNILIKEFTINHKFEYIVSEIFSIAPDVLCFSCYIWNIEIVKHLCRTLKKIMPNIVIVLGGPEVISEYDYLLKDSMCDIIVIGEGEETFLEIFKYLYTGVGSLSDIDGIAFYENGVITNKRRDAISMDRLPFPYTDKLSCFENRVVYYESSRGCPFSCSYCMSSLETGVRYLPLERVFYELKFFLENKTQLVKFTDRTFNCNISRAAAIWQFLKDNDNGISCFHFEIAADLLTDSLFDILKSARKGLFQFEIGVQTVNADVLDTIQRKCNLPALFASVGKLKSFSNIKLHLDLIAGLPGENFESFKNSFNKVYELNPDALQIEPLKMLKGLNIRKNYGIVYDDLPPYTVLKTKDISYAELQILSNIEELVNLYFNSGKLYYTLCSCIHNPETAFDFYYNLSEYWLKNSLYGTQHGRTKLYSILYEFLISFMPEQISFIKDLITFDMCRAEKMKSMPYFAYGNANKAIIRELFLRYVPQGKHKLYHIQLFQYDIINWISSGFKDIEQSETYILFDYVGNSQCKLQNLKI